MKIKKTYWQISFLAFLIVGTILIIHQQRTTPYQHDTGYIFGTTYHITYQSEKDLNNEILAELNKVDLSLSTYNKRSIISRINKNEDIKPDKMFLDVFNLAEEISSETNGAFDITVAPLVNLWGFGFKNISKPDKHSVDSIRRFVGFEKVKILNGKIKKQDPRIMLDCSAIAKGYGCDVVANYLLSQDIKNFMIEIGGEIVTRGISEKRLPWRIGVNKPTDDPESNNSEIQTILNVTDKAMATSGNYRKFYFKNGKKYAHTIDPKTGYPVQHNILSATVLAKDCATADAYATAFMTMGLKPAQKILDNHPELMALFIYSNEKGQNKVWYSPSLKDKVMN